jgi:SAM-dependent methyltransferase
MNLIERATAMHYHRHRLAQWGGAPQALGWKEAQSQRRRFEVIAAAADFAHCSVLDVGCGRADLKAFLDERFPGVSYTGIDQMPEFIQLAASRHGQGDAGRFLLGDFSAIELPAADYVVACGALGYRCAEAGYHLRMIRKFFAAARRALVFNVLDASRFPEHPLLVGRDCEEVLDLCRRLSPDVAVSRGYLEDDMTVCVGAVARRAPSAPERELT